jgi:hypothetical protein
MDESLDQQMEKLMQSGASKRTILNKLSTPENRALLIRYLNNNALPGQRRDNRWINLLLASLLAFLTVERLMVTWMIFSSNNYSLQAAAYLILPLMIPLVNIYVLAKIMRFQRHGYLFLTVISILAFLQPINRTVPYLFLYLVMIGLSLFIMLRLYPKEEQLR